MQPSDIYLPYMEAVQEKIYLSKIIIEFVASNEQATYEDLLNKIQTTVPPPELQISALTEDSLLRHAQWVVDQVRKVTHVGLNVSKFLFIGISVLVWLCTPCME